MTTQDPSSPETRPTLPPVSTDAEAGNASERPNAGQDEGCGADGCTSFGGCLVCVREAAFEEGRGGMVEALEAERRRADAVEAELRFANRRIEGLETSTAEAWLNHGVALAERKAAQAKLAEAKRLHDEAYARHRQALYEALGCTGAEGSLIALITENVASVVAERDEATEMLGFEKEARLDARKRGTRYRRERDQARAKLDQVREVIAEDVSTRARFKVDTSTSYGPRFLNRIRAITEPVTDREEPARGYVPCAYQVIPGVSREDGGYCIANATDGEYCKPHADALRTTSEEPAPDGTDGSLIAEYERNRRVMPPCCRRCWEPERSCRCVEGFWSSATLREPEEPAQHIGRSWGDHPLEDGCPCPQAPCGLVSTDEVSADCPEHPMQRGKTIRQSHSATECPALKTDEENR